MTYAVAEAELGAVQSKATKLVVFARFRLGCGHTPRSKGLLEFARAILLFSVPLEPNFKALSPVALPCSGRCAGATDQRPDDALRLRWPSCARRPVRVNLWPGRPSAFAPADTAAGTATLRAGTLHQRRADPRITALGHAAWNAFAATCAFAGTKPGVGTDGATIVEPMPIADLAREHNAGELAHAPREN